jgi:hypothetical protein
MLRHTQQMKVDAEAEEMKVDAEQMKVDAEADL